MILRDRVVLARRVKVGTDPDYGNDVFETRETPCRAEVRALGSSVVVDRSAPTVTRYRLFLPASAFPLADQDAIRWRGHTLQIEGQVEEHTLGGRLHHLEAEVSIST